MPIFTLDPCASIQISTTADKLILNLECSEKPRNDFNRQIFQPQNRKKQLILETQSGGLETAVLEARSEQALIEDM